jgi:glyoxalase-like protein
MDAPSPRPIDHAVLPVRDLATARNRLTKLGFTVAPEGHHPFGTANCCVYFEDGTFLEPLAVADAAALAGNAFAARDAGYRQSAGNEGFSALAMGTGNAAADHAIFVENGFSAGQVLEFSRPFVGASGIEDTASFRLAFAADQRATDSLFFTCQRINVPKVDRGALQVHANCTSRIASVLLSADQPSAYASVLATVVGGAPPTDIDAGIELRASDALVTVLTPARLHDEFGLNGRAGRSLSLVGLIFETASAPACQGVLRAAQVPHERRGNRLIVQPAPGQGALFAFEEHQ